MLATALGLKFKNGVVLAADRRVSYGTFILSRSARKVFPVNDRVGVAFAGLPADFQELYDSLIYNIRIYELDERKKATPANVARLLSILLYSGRFSRFFLAEIVVGGLSPDGPQIIAVDAAGGMLEDDFAAEGTGAQLATGILEREFRKDMEESEAVELAKRAMIAAIERDALSGDGIDLVVITEEGVREEFVPVRKPWRAAELER
ncbi:MAG TPA: proteasome subunit beta [Candidatus Korarchaeota archaeon]|nr:proteasome subunit beta [Candidatus Korarchaeota archaeon]